MRGFFLWVKEMAQESRLVIVVDSKGAKTNADELARAMAALDSAGVRVTRSTSEVSSTMRNMASEADAAAISIKKGLTAALGGLSAMKVIDIADEWGQFSSRIRMATKSTEEYELVQKRMAKSAQITFRAINETRESFIQMSPVLRDMGLSLEHSIDAIDTFSGLLVVNGANAQRGAAAMEALAKSLQRGRVDAQAWMTIYSTVDNVVDLLADTTGKATDEIRRLGIEGKISAEMIATALVQGNEKVIKAVEEMPTTVRDAMQNVNTAFSEYIGRTNEANQITATLAEGLSLLGNNLDSVLNVAIVAAGVGLTAYSAKTALALAETGKLTAAKIAEAAASRNGAIATEMYAKARLAEAQATVASATGMQRLTLVQTTLTPAQRQLEAATKAVAVANRGLGASMLGLVGGPVGALTLAVTVGAGAWYGYQKRLDESKSRLEGMIVPVENLRGELAKLNQDQLKIEQIKISSDIRDVEKNTEALAQAIRSIEKDYQALAKSSGVTEEELEQLNLTLLETRQEYRESAQDLEALKHRQEEGAKVLAQLKESALSAGKGLSDLGSSAKGLSETDFTKLVSGLQQSLDVIGMSAQQAAEYKARLEGANEQQAQLAGVLAGMADAARLMEKATQEKDEKAAKGAQALLDKLIEQEVQLRMNMTRAAEYAALIALGIEATIAAQGADTAAQLEGLKAQEEIVARVKSITANIGKNTVPSLKKTGEAAKKLAGEIDNLVGSLFPAIKAESDWIKQQKLLDQALKKGKITQEQYTKGLAKLQEAYELIAFEVPKHVQAIKDETQSIKSSIPSLRQRVDTFGLSATAIARNAEAETRARIATLNNIKTIELAKGASAEYVKQIEQEIAAMKDLLTQQEHMTGLVSQQERLEAEQKYYQDVADEAKRTHEEIERSLMDTLMRGFEGGKDFAKNALDTIKNMFNTLVLRPLIQPVVAGAAGLVTSMLGFGGTANAQGLGGGIDPITGLSTAKNLMGGMSWFTDFTGTMGGSLMDAGMYLQKFDGIVGDFGNTILGNIDTIAGAAQMAGAAWNYGKGIYDLTKGSYGAGIGAIGGQLLGGPIGGMIGNALGGMLDKAFKGETRAGGGFIYDRTMEQARFVGGPSGGYGGTETIGAMTTILDSQMKMIQGVLDSIGTVNAQVVNTWGAFESSDKGRGGTFSGGTLIIDGAEVRFGTDKKGAGYGGRSGSAEEMYQNMLADMSFSTLEAWKSVSDQLPSVIAGSLRAVDIRSLTVEQAQGLTAEIQATVSSVTALSAAFSQMPMVNLRDLTFDATASLIQFAGGLGQLQAGTATYFEHFYSRQEKLAFASEQLSSSFADLGLQMPSLTQGADLAKAEFRSIAESLDLSSEAGQKAYAALMGWSGRFAQTVAEFDALNVSMDELEETSRAVADVLREREGLERQLLLVQGDTAALRVLDLAALDESNRALQERIWATQDQLQVNSELLRLERLLLQVQGDTVALRRLDSAALDESNQALQEHIWAIQDQSAAVAERIQAEQKAYQEAKSHVDSLMSAFRELAQRQIRDLEQTFKVTDKMANALQSALNTQISSLSSVTSMLNDMIGELRGGAHLFSMQAAEGWRLIGNTISTGVIPDADKLRSAIGSIQSDLGDRFYDSMFERQRDQLVLANQLDSINALAKPQLTIAEQQLQVMQDQLAELREGTKRAFELAGLSQAQIAAIKSVDDKTASSIGLTKEQLTALRTGNNARVVLQNLTREQIQGVLGVKAETNSLYGLSQSQIAAMREVDLNTQTAAELTKRLQTAIDAEILANRQIDAVNLQLDAMTKQYDQLRGVNLSMSSLDEGMRLLAVAMKAEQAAKPTPINPSPGGATGFGSDGYKLTFNEGVSFILGNAGIMQKYSKDVAKGLATHTETGLRNWAQSYHDENLGSKIGSISNLGRTHRPRTTTEAWAYVSDRSIFDQYVNAARFDSSFQGDSGALRWAQAIWDQHGPIRKYAKGGVHPGGLRLVGELGPELEVTGPSRIVNASKTQDILRGMSSGPDISGLMHSLIRESQELRRMYESAMRSMIQMQQRMTRVLERWEGDDYPVRVEEMPDAPVVVIHKEVA